MTSTLHVRDLAAATPASRDRYVDLLRALAILTVVLGHWLIAVVTWDGGSAEAANALAEAPALQWLTWVFQVMPLFFVVGGFANRAALLAGRRKGQATSDYVRSRILRLVGPVLPLAAAWVVAGPVLRLLGVDDATVALATRTMAQPLWFLAVYLVVSVAAPWTLRFHERHPTLGIVLPAAATVANDVARLPVVHHANYLFVFVLAHQLGYALGDGTLLRLRRRTAVALTAGGALALAVLTGPGPYPRSMVGVPGEAMSNMSPPSMCILALTAMQLGLVLLARPAAQRALQDRRLWSAVIAVNASIMTIFLWHLTALAIGAALLVASPLGLPSADVGSAAWWLGRVPWLMTLSVVLAGIVVVAGRAERSALRPSPAGGRSLGAGGTVAVVTVTTTAFAALALEGFGGGAAVAATGALYLMRRMLTGYR